MVKVAALWIRGGELLQLLRILAAVYDLQTWGLDFYGKGAEGLSWDKTSRAIHLREDMFPDACHVPRPDTFQAASLPQNYLFNFDLTRGFDSHHPLQFINWIW